MRAYTTKSALKTVVENFRKPRQLFMYHPIKFEINGTFPTTTTELYSKSLNGTTYWLANMSSSLDTDRQIFTHDGKFREDDFLQIFDEFCRKLGLFTSSTPNTVAEKCYTEAIQKYVSKKRIGAKVERSRSAHFFAMNESQLFKYRHYEDASSLPDGYSIDVPEPAKHADMIVSTSKESAEHVTEKLKRFPSLCVKKGDELAGIISSNSHGALAHLYVSDNHRGKNLSEKLEIGAAKMAIESGIRPCKFIDTSNQFYLEKTRKSKMMDIVEANGSPIVIHQNTYQITNNHATLLQ